MFKKIKHLLHENAIGKIRFADMRFLKPALSPEEMEIPKTKWRVDPLVAGGGLFHDLAPHQLDLMIYFLGEIKTMAGVSANQDRQYDADDIVSGTILFESNVIFTGLWCFTIPGNETTDHCEFIGSEGKITFSIFDNPVINLTRKGKKEIIEFEKIPHVQQPMIEKVVEYFLGRGPNPCSPEDGVKVMEIIDAFTGMSEQ
jgi:predicted dehydrogenase